MAQQVSQQLQVCQTPDLHDFIPSPGYDEWSSGIRVEPHTRDPISVAIFCDGVLALSKGIPDLQNKWSGGKRPSWAHFHLLISGTRDDLTVVSTKCASQNILCVSREFASALPVAEIPQSHGAIPTGCQGKLAVGGRDWVADEISSRELCIDEREVDRWRNSKTTPT